MRVCAVWLKKIAMLTVCYTQHDGQQADQRLLGGKRNVQAFRQKSADSDCYLAATSLRQPSLALPAFRRQSYNTKHTVRCS